MQTWRTAKHAWPAIQRLSQQSYNLGIVKIGADAAGVAGDGAEFVYHRLHHKPDVTGDYDPVR